MTFMLTVAKKNVKLKKTFKEAKLNYFSFCFVKIERHDVNVTVSILTKQ